MKPDYSRYSEEQLLDVQQHIDRECFPERAEEIDALLSDPQTLARARAIQAELYRLAQQRRHQIHQLLLSLTPLLVGSVIGLVGSSPSFAGNVLTLYNIPVHYVISLILISIGCLGLYCLHRKRTR